MNTIEPNKIFIDTSAWIEFALAKEKFHKQVDDYLASEVVKGSKFFTSDYVLDETFTRLLSIQSVRSATFFKKHVSKLEKAKQLVILWTDKVLFNKAWNCFEKFAEHKLSFTDATIYAFVKDLKIDEVLTLDQGFKKVGLSVKPVI